MFRTPRHASTPRSVTSPYASPLDVDKMSQKQAVYAPLLAGASQAKGPEALWHYFSDAAGTNNVLHLLTQRQWPLQLDVPVGGHSIGSKQLAYKLAEALVWAFTNGKPEPAESLLDHFILRNAGDAPMPGDADFIRTTLWYLLATTESDQQAAVVDILYRLPYPMLMEVLPGPAQTAEHSDANADGETLGRNLLAQAVRQGSNIVARELLGDDLYAAAVQRQVANIQETTDSSQAKLASQTFKDEAKKAVKKQKRRMIAAKSDGRVGAVEESGVGALIHAVLSANIEALVLLWRHAGKETKAEFLEAIDQKQAMVATPAGATGETYKALTFDQGLAARECVVLEHEPTQSLQTALPDDTANYAPISLFLALFQTLSVSGDRRHESPSWDPSLVSKNRAGFAAYFSNGAIIEGIVQCFNLCPGEELSSVLLSTLRSFNINDRLKMRAVLPDDQKLSLDVAPDLTIASYADASEDAKTVHALEKFVATVAAVDGSPFNFVTTLSQVVLDQPQLLAKVTGWVKLLAEQALAADGKSALAVEMVERLLTLAGDLSQARTNQEFVALFYLYAQVYQYKPELCPAFHSSRDNSLLGLYAIYQQCLAAPMPTAPAVGAGRASNSVEITPVDLSRFAVELHQLSRAMDAQIKPSVEASTVAAPAAGAGMSAAGVPAVAPATLTIAQAKALVTAGYNFDAVPPKGEDASEYDFNTMFAADAELQDLQASLKAAKDELQTACEVLESLQAASRSPAAGAESAEPPVVDEGGDAAVVVDPLKAAQDDFSQKDQAFKQAENAVQALKQDLLNTWVERLVMDCTVCAAKQDYVNWIWSSIQQMSKAAFGADATVMLAEALWDAMQGKTIQQPSPLGSVADSAFYQLLLSGESCVRAREILAKFQDAFRFNITPQDALILIDRQSIDPGHPKLQTAKVSWLLQQSFVFPSDGSIGWATLFEGQEKVPALQHRASVMLAVLQALAASVEAADKTAFVRLFEGYMKLFSDCPAYCPLFDTPSAFGKETLHGLFDTYTKFGGTVVTVDNLRKGILKQMDVTNPVGVDQLKRWIEKHGYRFGAGSGNLSTKDIADKFGRMLDTLAAQANPADSSVTPGGDAASDTTVPYEGVGAAPDDAPAAAGGADPSLAEGADVVQLAEQAQQYNQAGQTLLQTWVQAYVNDCAAGKLGEEVAKTQWAAIHDSFDVYAAEAVVESSEFPQWFIAATGSVQDAAQRANITALLSQAANDMIIVLLDDTKTVHDRVSILETLYARSPITFTRDHLLKLLNSRGTQQDGLDVLYWFLGKFAEDANGLDSILNAQDGSSQLPMAVLMDVNSQADNATELERLATIATVLIKHGAKLQCEVDMESGPRTLYQLAVSDVYRTKPIAKVIRRAVNREARLRYLWTLIPIAIVVGAVLVQALHTSVETWIFAHTVVHGVIVLGALLALLTAVLLFIGLQSTHEAKYTAALPEATPVDNEQSASPKPAPTSASEIATAAAPALPSSAGAQPHAPECKHPGGGEPAAGASPTIHQGGVPEFKVDPDKTDGDTDLAQAAEV